MENITIKHQKCLAINGGTPVRSNPFPPLYLGTQIMGDEELELLTEVVKTRLPFRDYGAGTPHMVIDFESLTRKYFDSPYALATATGSGTFYCAMAGLGLGPGDEVIIPAFSWFSDFEAPVMLGALPVLADIDRSLCMCPNDFARKISPRTKAVIYVHFQGGAGNFDRILEIAKANNIKVVEDCAQACGASFKGKKLGTSGDVGCFSFQQNKIMSTGDGGLLLARDPSIFERAVRFHDLGNVRKGLAKQLNHDLTEPQMCGSQFRMNEFTGAVALAQLRKLDSHILDITRKYFRRIHGILQENCPGMKFRDGLDLEGDAGIAFYMDMGTPERGKWFASALSAEGIPVGPTSNCSNLLNTDVVKKKIQAHPALPPFGPGWSGENVTYCPEDCPHTDDILKTMVCVPIIPAFTDQDIDDIVTAITKVWKHCS